MSVDSFHDDSSRSRDDESLTLSGTIADPRARRSDVRDWPHAGVALERYVLRRRLGRGGMGEVWAAWDDRLAREVAIKVVRLRDAKAADVQAERLAREARALARVSDPHVVQVYDVGSYDTTTASGTRIHGVFVVMELVRGLTLSEWISSGSRSTEEVVRLFLAAGRGLATAHAAGLVHRDMKPSNVFVGDDGRVRIGDFGLARSASSSNAGIVSLTAVEPRVVANDETLSGSLTDTGTVVGTPLYMAPEQHGGVVVDARGDQYAFCVALYEALYRVRPFAGSLEAIARAKWARKLATPAFDDVPLSVRDAVWRGLSPKPADRWPSMTDLVDALERGIRRRRRAEPWLAAAGGIIAVATLAIVTTGARDERCDPIGAEVWTDTRRADLAAQGRAAAPVADYLAAIDALQSELCGEPADAHVAELQCLRRAAGEVDGLVAVLEEPGRAVPDLAALLEGLPEVEACRRATVGHGPPIDERDRHAVEGELRRLSRGEVLWRSERHHEALAIAESVLLSVEAGRVPPGPVRARARLLSGKAYDGLDADEAAEVALSDAYFEGAAAGDAETAFEASRMLAMTTAERRELQEAERWVRHAEVEYARLEPTPVLTARLANARAGLYMFSDELERAVAEFRAAATACSLEECASGVSITMNLAAVLWRLGEADEAEQLRRAALAELERRFGSDSPASVQARLDLVHSFTQSGRIDEAETYLVAAEAIIERWTEPTHRYRILAADQRAEILIARGDPGGAVELLERSWDIVDQTFPPDDLRRVSRLNDLAFAYLVSGRGDEALATIARARALTERVDATSFEHGALMVSSGYIKGELGDYEGALADLHEARRVIEVLLPADHPMMAQCDTNEARVLVLAGRQAEALPIWEAAVKASEAAPPGDRGAVDSRIALAECLLDLGHDERALAVLDRLAGQPFEFAAHAAILDFVRARAIAARDRAGAIELARSARIALRRHPTVDASVIDIWLAANGGTEE